MVSMATTVSSNGGDLMTRPTAFRLATTVALLVSAGTLIPSFAADAPAQAAATGDLWEVTSQMSMEGIPMALPAHKSKVCAPKEWKEPPGSADERMKCSNSDYKVDGPKASWKTVCAGPPAMTGEGEITRDGADAYAGAIKFTSSDGAMTLKLSGRRLGDCTPPQK